MMEHGEAFIDKAVESLIGAESEFDGSRYNNCANRVYYACFQAAIFALHGAGVIPRGTSGQWSHAFVPAQFDGILINRRKLYPTDLRNILAQTYALRQKADYRRDSVNRAEAARVLRHARRFVEAIRTRT